MFHCPQNYIFQKIPFEKFLVQFAISLIRTDFWLLIKSALSLDNSLKILLFFKINLQKKNMNTTYWTNESNPSSIGS
jgi:hypothetical protein